MFGTNKKAVVLFSGGLDSTVLLTLMKEEQFDVYALSVDYGQRHGDEELEHARRVARTLAVTHHHIVRFDPSMWRLFESRTSCLTNPEVPVPEGHYEDATMKQTVVPNRNMVLLSLATAWAVALEAHVVAYAAHGGDHAIYPDCRKAFVAAMALAIGFSDWKPPTLYAPFVCLQMTKADVVNLGNDIGAPMEMSYSCYNGRLRHCGKCATCVERKEAFALAGIDDPTEYESADADEPLTSEEWNEECR